MRKLTLVLAIGALVGTPASAQSDGPLYGTAHVQRDPQAHYRVGAAQPTKQCFNGRYVTAANRAGDRTLYVQTRTAAVYTVDFVAPCAELDRAKKLRLRALGSDQVCPGEPAEVVIRASEGTSRCRAASVRRTTPTEIAALSSPQAR